MAVEGVASHLDVWNEALTASGVGLVLVIYTRRANRCEGKK